MSCRTPIDDARLVAYWANDLAADEAAELEEHVFGCDLCCAASERIANIVQVFRTSLPPIISVAELAALQARGLAIIENAFAAGQRQPVTFASGVDLLVHRLGGLDLADAERVEVIVRNESGTVVMTEEPFAPFDRERGEVLIACQRHFAAFPQDVAIDVRVHRPRASPRLATYFIPHVYLP